MMVMTSEDVWTIAGDLEVGHQVWTKHELTGEFGLFNIIECNRRTQPVVKVTVQDKSVTVSDSHRFLTESGNYVPVSDLEAGSLIQTLDGTFAIDSIESVGEMEVVGLEVDSAHTYIVEGFISHNKVYAGSNHRWYDAGGGYHYGPYPSGGYYNQFGHFIQGIGNNGEPGTSYYGYYYGAY
jgi:hypothetical protein